MASRDCSHSFKNFTAKKKEKRKKHTHTHAHTQENNTEWAAGGEESHLKYLVFGDMDSSLACIKILDYWYWKIVDYRIQVTFGNINKTFYIT